MIKTDLTPDVLSRIARKSGYDLNVINRSEEINKSINQFVAVGVDRVVMHVRDQLPVCLFMRVLQSSFRLIQSSFQS